MAMKRAFGSCLIGVGLTLSGSPCLGQSESTPLPARGNGGIPVLEGRLVVLTTRQGEKIRGVVTQSSLRSISLAAPDSVVTFSETEIRRIRRFVRHTPFPPMAIGAGVGFIAGMAYGIDKWNKPDLKDSFAALAVPVLVLLNGVEGCAIGAGVGLGVGLVFPMQTWATVYPNRPPPRFSSGRIQAGLKIRF